MERSFLPQELLRRHLEISSSTAELAYEQLLSEGYIESEPCRGYFVAKIDELYQIRPAKTPTEEKKEQKLRYRYDFTPNGVDLKSFPYNAWRKLSKDILTDDKTELFRSGESKGELWVPAGNLQLSASGQRRELYTGTGNCWCRK